MTRLQSNEWLWIGSDAINYEVGQIPNVDRRNRINVLTSAVHRAVTLTKTEAVRAKDLQSLGFKQWDALHLACAESGQADIFLTTDDKLLRLSRRVALKIRVENPLNWLTEVTE
jgi:predicted nucleic acid-binding protein